jgi:hypothetical protein
MDLPAGSGSPGPWRRSCRAREALLRAASPDTTALVDAIAVKPEGLFWGDIQPHEEHWINACVASYYGLKAVRTRGPALQVENAGPPDAPERP